VSKNTTLTSAWMNGRQLDYGKNAGLMLKTVNNREGVHMKKQVRTEVF
jgi:hypothetical protein